MGNDGTYITLSALQERIQSRLRSDFPEPVLIVAELSDLRVNRVSGHCYMELVERAEGMSVARAKARGVIWSSGVADIFKRYREATGAYPASGDKALLQVTVSYHQAYGLSLVISDIDPTFALGEKEMQRRKTIERLKAEGLWDLNRSIEYAEPVFQRIAVVSADGAAGYQDFMREIELSPHRIVTELFRASVQGQGAETEIPAAIAEASARRNEFDALVIIRGGGSQTDLECFDSYAVAAAAARCPLPVLTGIGHDRDESVTDMVAYRKLKTPTAAAQEIVRGCDELWSVIDGLALSLGTACRERMRATQTMLTDASASVVSAAREACTAVRGRLDMGSLRIREASSRRTLAMRTALESGMQAARLGACHAVFSQRRSISFSAESLRTAARTGTSAALTGLRIAGISLADTSARSLQEQRTLLREYSSDLLRGTARQMESQRLRTESAERIVEAASPEAALRRGFSIVRHADSVITDPSSLEQGDRITITFLRGTREATISDSSHGARE